jgi:hypothetical protein
MKVIKEDLELGGMPSTKDSVLAFRLLEKERPEPRHVTFLLGFLAGFTGGVPLIFLVWFCTSWFTDVFETRLFSTAVTVGGFLSALVDTAIKSEQNTRLTYDNKVPLER